MNAVSVSLVIPVYNEVASLPALVHRCVAVGQGLQRPFEIVLVDDGSQDGSADLIRSAVRGHRGRIVGLFLNRNYGQHAAIMAGLSASTGEIVVTLDADLQNPPEEIPKLLAEIDVGCDVVGSVRRLRRDPLYRRLGSFIINKAVQRATGVSMRDYGWMLRAYRRPVVDAMLRCGERSTFMLDEVLPLIMAGRAPRTPQNHERASYHGRRRVEDGEIDWSLSACSIRNLVRATTRPYPGAFTYYAQRKLTV